MEYIEIENANIFLENPNHYLIVERESKLEQIDEKLRRIIVSEYPYRHRQSAYLLHGRQLQDNSGLKRERQPKAAAGRALSGTD